MPAQAKALATLVAAMPTEAALCNSTGCFVAACCSEDGPDVEPLAGVGFAGVAVAAAGFFRLDLALEGDLLRVLLGERVPFAAARPRAALLAGEVFREGGMPWRSVRVKCCGSEPHASAGPLHLAAVHSRFSLGRMCRLVQASVPLTEAVSLKSALKSPEV